MATLRQPAREPVTSTPSLRTSGGHPVSVVHIAAEYFPYARTGGLAEAVSGLANFQQAAGLDVTAILPCIARFVMLIRISSRWASPFWSRWDHTPRRRESSG